MFRRNDREPVNSGNGLPHLVERTFTVPTRVEATLPEASNWPSWYGTLGLDDVGGCPGRLVPKARSREVAPCIDRCAIRLCGLSNRGFEREIRGLTSRRQEGETVQQNRGARDIDTMNAHRRPSAPSFNKQDIQKQWAFRKHMIFDRT
jgi:hypothetical protein